MRRCLPASPHITSPVGVLCAKVSASIATHHQSSGGSVCEGVCQHRHTSPVQWGFCVRRCLPASPHITSPVGVLCAKVSASIATHHQSSGGSVCEGVCQHRHTSPVQWGFCVRRCLPASPHITSPMGVLCAKVSASIATHHQSSGGSVCEGVCQLYCSH